MTIVQIWGAFKSVVWIATLRAKKDGFMNILAR